MGVIGECSTVQPYIDPVFYLDLIASVPIGTSSFDEISPSLAVVWLPFLPWSTLCPFLVDRIRMSYARSFWGSASCFFYRRLAQIYAHTLPIYLLTVSCKAGRFLYIHCVSKKRPTFKLSLSLSNLNRFSKFLHCWKAYEICYKSHMTIPTLP